MSKPAIRAVTEADIPAITAIYGHAVLNGTASYEYDPPTLQEMLGMIAKLGGYQGRKCDGPPGPKTIWIGLQRMRDFAIAWAAFGPAHTKRCVER